MRDASYDWVLKSTGLKGCRFEPQLDSARLEHPFMAWIFFEVRGIHAKGDVLPIVAHRGAWKRPHWIEVLESDNCQVLEVGLCHEA